MKPNFHDRGYFALCAERVLLKENIIGVFDVDSTTVSKETRNFLSAAEKEGRIKTYFSDLPITFLVCSDRRQPNEVLLTGFTLNTLTGRLCRPLRSADLPGEIK